MTEVLQSMAEDKARRVRAVDATLRDHTSMLEFCVDTHDPNAHKHKKVLEELQRLRDQLEEDIDANREMEKSVHAQCTNVLRCACAPPDRSQHFVV